MDIGAVYRGHLALLHRRHAAFREQNENIDVFAVAAGFYRGRPGIAGRRTDNGDPFPTRCKHMGEHASDQLQGKILEGQRRPLKQFHQPVVRADLFEWRNSHMAETGIGLFDHFLQIAIRDGAADERADHPVGDFRIGHPGHG